MTRLLVYFLLFGVILWALSAWSRRQIIPAELKNVKPGRWFRAKRNPAEVWVQVYETATLEEARPLQARLQEEEVECVVYEQGKKDIHGNALKGIGIAVPRTLAGQAQRIISRILT
ncbi:MAG: hypothetical protein HYZ85_05585 [Candidatus Omnitrophica bacterium]|nr:hypothetical protein [Candidatus Omnitrophota bacterium]